MKRLILGGLVVLLSAQAIANEQAPTTVEDMRYGVALYHYYQGDYMQALTELLVAKARGGIQGHGDNPEIMEGGFSLGFGLERHASDIFARLLQENRSPQSQDAAWFFLSKLRYLRADWQGAEDALSKVRDKPVQGIRQDIYAHRINLAIRQDRLQDAKNLIRQRNPGNAWMPYIYFNLGAAYARKQEFDQAVGYFKRLAAEPFPTDELRALYDKAMTSAGYTYLMTQDYEQAIAYFQRVRLTSNLANRALLGYGWAAAELGRFEDALKPWTFLANSSLVDENSQEALIAVPYAYEQLGKKGLALHHFQRAEQEFLQEMQRLQGVIDNLSGYQLLDALKIARSGGMDWLKHVRENQLSPQLSYLATLFSQEEFQGVVQELRDLVGIKEDIQRWRDKLDFYHDLVNERELGRNHQAEALATRELTAAIEQMNAERSELAQTIEQIDSDKDYFALATAEERDLIDRVLRSQRHIERLRDSDPFIDESEAAMRRYYGLLYWEASETFSDRLWRVRKTLNLLDNTLATVMRNHQKVQYLINNAEDLAPMKARLGAISVRVERMLTDVDTIIAKTQDDLRQQTAQVLLAQRARLNHYIAQSRLSSARLYDQSLQNSKVPPRPASETEPETEPRRQSIEETQS